MDVTNILAKLPSAEQQALQQFYRMDMMKKLKSQVVIVGIPKEVAIIQKPRESGEPLHLGIITLADGLGLTMFDPEVDLESLKGEQHHFLASGAREYKGKISYTVSDVLDAEKVKEVLGLPNGKPQTSEVPVMPRPTPIPMPQVTEAKESPQEHAQTQEAAKKAARLPIIGKQG